jgi:protein-S-isoprenylcysteine O-methyltransferase Ste14
MNLDRSAHGAPIKFPPPLLYVSGFLLGVGLRALSPGDALPPSLARIAHPIGIALALAGVVVSLSGVATFLLAKTTTIPHKAPARLVTHGPYRFTRNPMYLGLNLTYVGASLWLNRMWPLLILPIVFTVLLRAVILVEERYMAERFGEEYRAYAARVRRFL